jgi:hypothetical protein
VTDRNPPGFLRFSEACNRLAAGMWGGLPRPAPVKEITRGTASVVFGPWRVQARKRLTQVAVKGQLQVYGLTEGAVPVPVPKSVLTAIPKPRGGLSDVPYRLTLRKVLDAGGTEQLFVTLTRGHLALREAEFAAWYRGERGHGKWASQKSRSKTRGGRPTKQTERLRGWILKFVEDKSWRAEKPIILLRHLLTASIGPDIPSDDTLARLVDNLFLETGEPGLRRNRKRSARDIKELRRPLCTTSSPRRLRRE